MRKRSIAPTTAGILLALAGSAHAASKTTTFSVSAADVTATSGIDVRCTTGSPYTLKLDAGSGTFGQRLLSAAGIATAPRSTSTQIERFIVRVQGVRVSSELPPTHQGR